MTNDSSKSNQGRLALITGGSHGMGLALARLMAQDGTNVWLVARHTDGLEAACRSLPTSAGQRHGYYSTDVTDWNQVQSTVERFQQEVGVPDYLINVAGAAHPGYFEDLPLEVFRDMMELNYFGAVHTVKATLPAMLKRGSGHIINFSSVGGFMAPFGYSAYCPSKYAVRGFSDALRLELKPLGIRVSIVFPPDTDTPGMTNENKTKPFETKDAFSTKLLSADVVAKSILGGIKRRRYIILPGSEAALYYRLVAPMDGLVYSVFDMMLAGARKKKLKSEGTNGHL
jgi:3-dehydrosphinganine reductase